MVSVSQTMSVPVIQNEPRSSAVPSDPQTNREAEMISRIVAGERELFFDLIKPYERAVFLTAYSVLRCEADAEEIA